jgi:MinD-like ATPase involved in chromosome partitioning or flagellar assembly
VIIAIGSVHGSPGATTLAVTLASVWPGASPILMEVDPDGGILAARLGLADEPGFMGLVAALHSRSLEPGEILSFAQKSGELPVIPGAASPEQAAAALSATSGSLLDTLRPNHTTIIDVGRIVPRSAAMPLILGCDEVWVVAESTVEQLRLAALRVRALMPLVPTVGIVTVGSDYEAAEISTTLEAPVIGSIARDPKTAQALQGLRSAPRSLARSPLMRSVAELARQAESRAMANRHIDVGPT